MPGITVTGGTVMDVDMSASTQTAAPITSLKEGKGGVQGQPDSFWTHVQEGVDDSIIGLMEAYNRDTYPKKIGLTVGAYRDENGKPYYLNAVREAERRIFSDSSETKEYPGIAGLARFNKANDEMLFGADSCLLAQKRCATVQCVSGSGALRVGAEFIARFHLNKTVYIPDPSWANHYQLFPEAGCGLQMYTYYDEATLSLNFEGMMESLESLEAKTPVLFQVAAHNPTGVDPTPEQWRAIVEVCARKRLLPFLDNAYQGFATGDFEKDAYPLRLFAQSGLEFMVANSFSKNMGLYAERAGALTIVCGSQDVAGKVLSQVKQFLRPLYSMPPKHGAAVVARILEDPELKGMWLEELEGMSKRIQDMRVRLRAALEERKTPGKWQFLTEQIGMFSYTGFTAEQVQYLQDKWHVYMLSTGRMTLCGLTVKDIDTMADAVDDTIRNGPK